MDNEINIPLLGTVTAGTTAWALACLLQISCIRTSTSSLYVDDVDGAIVRRFARPAKSSWWIHSTGWKTKSTHFQSQFVCADTHGSSSSCCRISAKLWSAINAFLDGVLYTSPLPASSLAPIQAWLGWPPVKPSIEVVFEDTCRDWWFCRVSASRNPSIWRWIWLGSGSQLVSS